MLLEGVIEHSACRRNRVYRLQEVLYLEEDRHNLRVRCEEVIAWRPAASGGIELAGGKLNLQEVMGLYRPVASRG